MLGAALFIALALNALPRRSVLLVALLVACTVRVVARNHDWRNNETLFRRTVDTSPESARSHFLLGAELLEQERFDEAAASFAAGLRIAPQHVGARMSLGEAQLEAGTPVEAQAAFEDALARAPSDEVRERALTAALAAGRERARDAMWNDARRGFARALELDPRNVDATNSLGLVLERQGDVDTARSHYEAALAIDADYTPAVLNLASVRMQMGELAAAVELFSRAVTLAPSSYEAYNGLGIAMARRGRSGFSKSARDRYRCFFILNREDFSFVIHLDRQPRTSRRREAQTGSRARSGSRSERTLDAVEHSRTLMEWWPFLIFHRGGLRIKVINNTGLDAARDNLRALGKTP